MVTSGLIATTPEQRQVIQQKKDTTKTHQRQDVHLKQNTHQQLKIWNINHHEHQEILYSECMYPDSKKDEKL